MAINNQQWESMAPATRDRLLASGYEQRPSGAWGEGGVYASNPNVNWTYGGQSTTTPLNRQSFLTEGAARNLGQQLGPGFDPYGMQLGGPAAYSTPMQMFGQQNAGLAQDQLDRGMSVDDLRSQLNRERQMAQGTAIDPSRQMADGTLNRSTAQQQSEALYRAQGLVQGTDGQWRTPQNARQTSPAPPQNMTARPSGDGLNTTFSDGSMTRIAPAGTPSQQSRYGPMVDQMRQQQMRGAMGSGQNRFGGGLDRAGQPIGSLNPAYGPGEEDNSRFATMYMQGGGGGQRFNSGTGASWMPGDAPPMGGGGQPSFQNAMFAQRLGQYGGGSSNPYNAYQTEWLGGRGGGAGGDTTFGNTFSDYNPNPNGATSLSAYGQWGGDQPLSSRGYGMGGSSQFPSLQQVRSGQAQSLGYDPYYYSNTRPQGMQARQPGWIYPQNTGAFQLRNHGDSSINEMRAFNQQNQQRQNAGQWATSFDPYGNATGWSAARTPTAQQQPKPPDQAWG